jgi:transcriptional regulator with GAF, ATPase, and Fis domain
MLVTALMRPGVALSRIWLSARDHLQLAGSAGAPTGGGTYSRLDGQFGRIPAGEGKIGQIAQAGAPLIVRSLRGDEDWLANPGWIARQGVRAFLGYPLIHAREVFGVLAIFDRAACGDETIAEIEFVADYAAARLKDLRDRAALQAQLTVSEKRSATRTAPLAPQIVTRADLRSLEKQTIEAALAQSRGRVFGPHGAAMLLGMKPTTLASRIKALGIGDGRSGPASP